MRLSESLPEAVDPSLRALVRRGGREIVGSVRLGGGRNSLVLRLELDDGELLVAKRYAQRGRGRLDPLDVEERALRFLAARAAADVPRVEAIDLRNRWALLSHLPGHPIPSAAPRHGRALVAFLDLLDRLASAPAAADLPFASEASFSLSQIQRDIDRRFKGLQKIQGTEENGTVAHEMGTWLRVQLADAYTDFYRLAEERLQATALQPETSLPRKRWRLSPSDLGLHNMLEDDRGRIFFVDFEYFGWDDPAKTLCDLALHPRALPLPAIRSEVIDQRLKTLRAIDPEIDIRLQAYYPLFGIKWCLILLNEFIHQNLERRRSATGEVVDPRRLQLEKSQALLRRLRHEKSPF